VTDARRRAGEALARLDRWDAKYRPRTVEIDADDLRALLAEEDERGAVAAEIAGLPVHFVAHLPRGRVFMHPDTPKSGARDAWPPPMPSMIPVPIATAPPAADEVREAAGGTRYATRPDRGDNRVPYCSEQCPQHDGKRCRIMGVQPSLICEPEVLNLLADLATRGGE